MQEAAMRNRATRPERMELHFTAGDPPPCLTTDAHGSFVAILHYQIANCPIVHHHAQSKVVPGRISDILIFNTAVSVGGRLRRSTLQHDTHRRGGPQPPGQNSSTGTSQKPP